MPDLSFKVEDAKAQAYAAVPTISFRLLIDNGHDEQKIHSVALRAQILLEPSKRKYTPQEQNNLRDLFDTPERWGQTLRNTLWTQVSTVVPSFNGQTKVDLQVPCSFDFNVGATKFFYGLQEGEIPLVFQFSGSIFYESLQLGSLTVAPISWDKEAKYRLPVQVWRETIEMYYPNSAWLCLRRDAFDRLYQYKVRNGIPTWEEALEQILSSVEENVSL